MKPSERHSKKKYAFTHHNRCCMHKCKQFRRCLSLMALKIRLCNACAKTLGGFLPSIRSLSSAIQPAAAVLPQIFRLFGKCANDYQNINQEGRKTTTTPPPADLIENNIVVGPSVLFARLVQNISVVLASIIRLVNYLPVLVNAHSILVRSLVRNCFLQVSGLRLVGHWFFFYGPFRTSKIKNTHFHSNPSVKQIKIRI